MDLLITKGTASVKLSDYGFYNINIDDSAPGISLDKRSVTGRNGTVFGGATFNAKVIKVTGRVAVTNVQEFLSLLTHNQAIFLQVIFLKFLALKQQRI